MNAPHRFRRWTWAHLNLRRVAAIEPPGQESTTVEPKGRRGQAIVEFALISTAFFMIVFGTIDFGRAIFLNAELHNAVRDATREAKRETSNGSAGGGISQSLISNRVHRAQVPDGTNAEKDRPGLTNATVSYSCSGGCVSGNKITVTASVPFTAITQDLLGIDPIMLTASSTTTLE
jgi:Flp pilus assembly protein TadG